MHPQKTRPNFQPKQGIPFGGFQVYGIYFFRGGHLSGNQAFKGTLRHIALLAAAFGSVHGLVVPWRMKHPLKFKIILGIATNPPRSSQMVVKSKGFPQYILFFNFRPLIWRAYFFQMGWNHQIEFNIDNSTVVLEEGAFWNDRATLGWLHSTAGKPVRWLFEKKFPWSGSHCLQGRNISHCKVKSLCPPAPGNSIFVPKGVTIGNVSWQLVLWLPWLKVTRRQICPCQWENLENTLTLMYLQNYESMPCTQQMWCS